MEIISNFCHRNSESIIQAIKCDRVCTAKISNSEFNLLNVVKEQNIGVATIETLNHIHFTHTVCDDWRLTSFNIWNHRAVVHTQHTHTYSHVPREQLFVVIDVRKLATALSFSLFLSVFFLYHFRSFACLLLYSFTRIHKHIFVHSLTYTTIFIQLSIIDCTSHKIVLLFVCHT